MIEEDLEASNQNKLELIYQREELEQYSDKTKTDHDDLQLLYNLASGSLPDSDDEHSWDTLVRQLVQSKQRSLLLDLIRELHQYILGQSSNTTDNSVMQSDELEDLASLIEKETLPVTEAVDAISDFA